MRALYFIVCWLVQRLRSLSVLVTFRISGISAYESLDGETGFGTDSALRWTLRLRTNFVTSRENTVGEDPHVTYVSVPGPVCYGLRRLWPRRSRGSMCSFP